MQSMFLEAKKGTLYNELYQNGRVMFKPLSDILPILNDPSRTGFLTDDLLLQGNQECKVTIHNSQ
jgi:hypothetical protein